MKFGFLDSIPIVQQKKRLSTFRITPIGGGDMIVKWREMQAAKGDAYRMRLNARDQRISTFETLLGGNLDTPGLARQEWAEKVSFALLERKRLAEVENRVNEFPPWEIPAEPKKSLLEKIMGFLRRFWVNANF